MEICNAGAPIMMFVCGCFALRAFDDCNHNMGNLQLKAARKV